MLLDEEALSKGKAFFQVGAASHSPDHALYGWAADEQGSEYYTIRVKDLATGEELGQPVESAYGDFAFSPDSLWIFWIWRDENARPSKVFRRPARVEKTCWSMRKPTTACSWAWASRPTTATS